MKPTHRAREHLRPISFTSPMPFSVLFASTCAQSIACTARCARGPRTHAQSHRALRARLRQRRGRRASTAVSNPNDFSMSGTSLSIVLGTTATPQHTFCARASESCPARVRAAARGRALRGGGSHRLGQALHELQRPAVRAVAADDVQLRDRIPPGT